MQAGGERAEPQGYQGLNEPVGRPLSFALNERPLCDSVAVSPANHPIRRRPPGAASGGRRSRQAALR